jgi:selenocysteine lyase/cysteine desulfurase
VGFGSPERLIFTKNAVMRPLRYLESWRGVRIAFLDSNGDGLPKPGSLKAALASRPSLAVAAAASKVTGQLLSLDRIAAERRAEGVPLCVDASQLIGHEPLDFDRRWLPRRLNRS